MLNFMPLQLVKLLLKRAQLNYTPGKKLSDRLEKKTYRLDKNLARYFFAPKAYWMNGFG